MASDFATEVARWRRQLGEPGGISSNSKAETWGKTLPLWGSGEPESTYAVIILPREIAYCLIAGENSLKSLARGILVHELAHVHDNYRYRRDFGPQPEPTIDDSIDIRHLIAKGTWGEFFAQSIAYPYYPEDHREELVSLGLTRLQDSLQEIKQAKSDFQSHGNTATLWEVAIGKIGDAFFQLSRSIGLLTAAQRDGNEQFDQFFKGVNEISSTWGQIVRQLVRELNTLASQEKWDSESFNGLEDVIEQGFRATGLHPEYIPLPTD